MKYTKDITDKIDYLAAQGWSGRKIAYTYNLSKSGVNDYLNRNVKKSSSGPRILVLDVETAAALAWTFGRFKVNLSQNNIYKEGGYILCAAWKWLGEDEVTGITLSAKEIANGDDYRIVLALYEAYLQADAIVAHNGCSFDHKVIQTRAIANGLPPLPVVKVLDTLLLAKRYLRLPSNKLDSIGEYFGLGRKIDTGGIELWAKVQTGDRQAMQDMLEYNIQDVRLLEAVYLKLRALGTAGNAINAALYYDDEELRCNLCGSTDVEPTGRTIKTTLNSFAEMRCIGCGAVHRTRDGLTSKTKRKTLLATPL